jgi:hypothetical protein
LIRRRDLEDGRIGVVVESWPIRMVSLCGALMTPQAALLDGSPGGHAVIGFG